MANKRRSRSEMYQVDFVAALFGAFLLLWISKTGKGHVYSEANAGIVVFQAKCTGDSASLLPLRESQRCASAEIVEAAEQSLNLKHCDGAVYDPLLALTELRGAHQYDRVELEKQLNKKIPYLIATTMLAEVSLYDSNKKRIDEFTFGGMAISDGDAFTPEVAVGYGPTTPPAFVSIENADSVLLAVDCKFVSVPDCQLDMYSFFKGAFTTTDEPHQGFIVRLHSSDWPDECLETKGAVLTDGEPYALTECLP